MRGDNATDWGVFGLRRPSSGLSRLAALACLPLLLLLLPGRCLASPEASVRVLMLAERDDVENADRVAAAVDSQIAELGAHLEVLWTDAALDRVPAALDLAGAKAAARGAAVVFWCDLNAGADVYLFVADGADRRLLVRRLDRDAGDGARLEALAVIVHAVVDAVSRGGGIGIEPSAADAGEAPKKRADTVRFEIAMGYQAKGHSEDSPVTHGLDLFASLSFAQGALLFLGYEVQWPVTVGDGETVLRLASHPMRLGAGYRRSFRAFALSFSAALVADIVSQETLATAQGDRPRDNTDALMSIAPDITTWFDLPGDLRAFLGVGVQYDISTVEYVTASPSGRRLIADTWRWRPFARAGIAFSFRGE